MKYVYILESLDSEHFYVGITDWRLRTYFAFSDAQLAVAFEKYLKSGSGRAFAKKHF